MRLVYEMTRTHVTQTYGVWEDTGQVGEEALVDSQDTLGADSLEQAIKDTLVQVAGLVVHASHDGI